MILGSGISALAREIKSYDVTIPKFGSITTGEIKKVDLTKGVHNNTAIGGNKRINTSIRKASNNSDITPSYNMGPGDRILMSYSGGASAYKGTKTTLALSTPLTTVVSVDSQGSWSPDE